MSFFILFGKQDYDSDYQVQDKSVLLENTNGCYYCPNCHNYSVKPIKRKEFFTVWFIPFFPLFWGKQLHCNICNWRQDFSNEEQLRKIKNQNTGAIKA